MRIFVEKDQSTIMAADGNTMAVQGYGQIVLKVEQPGGGVRQLTLNKVALASGAPVNLLSVSRACNNTERMFRIGSKIATIGSGEETIQLRREGADLYKMKTTRCDEETASAFASKISKKEVSTAAAAAPTASEGSAAT